MRTCCARVRPRPCSAARCGGLHRGHLPAVLHLGRCPAARRRLPASARPRVGRRRRTGRSAPHHRPGFHHLRNLRPEESWWEQVLLHPRAGYHPLLAVAAGTDEVLHARLRGGPAHTSRGVSRFIAQTVQRVREAGARGEITLGADSGFCSHKVVRARHRRDVRFSITIPLHKRLHQTIAALPEEAWGAIPYVLPGAGLAEIPYTPFGKKGTPVRLIVRRVPPNPGSQLALFSACGYHAFICDRKGGHPLLGTGSPSPCRDRERDPRSEIRGGTQSSAFGEVRGQRGLVRLPGHGLQPGAVGEFPWISRDAPVDEDAAAPLPRPPGQAHPFRPALLRGTESGVSLSCAREEPGRARPPAPRTLHRTPSCVTANRPEQAMATICLREEHCEVSGGPAGGFGLR